MLSFPWGFGRRIKPVPSSSAGTPHQKQHTHRAVSMPRPFSAPVCASYPAWVVFPSLSSRLLSPAALLLRLWHFLVCCSRSGFRPTGPCACSPLPALPTLGCHAALTPDCPCSHRGRAYADCGSINHEWIWDVVAVQTWKCLRLVWTEQGIF